MADTDSNITISKTNTGFPPYLDFDKLRSSAIAYLGNLSGNIWTDYNAHDPGVTILEVLIYALTDLGYRTNMPIEDLLARSPDDKSKDDNFFTPARILANNPLTITDYRKMLVDIEHVKNAWLVIEDQWPVNLCNPPRKTNNDSKNNQNQTDPCHCDYLNGLYHVYIQLETDNLTTIELNKLKRKIRKTLMAYRNLCEDFIDITILCSLDLGVCAQIDLDATVDVQDVLFTIVESLSGFFSPSPVFYSLQQLLDKQKPIEEIFAGRPYNITESHGFIDTSEFEQLTLRKDLHLSDVYSQLAAIDGISRVRNLEWITCCDNKDNKTTSSKDWKLVLPTNYIPSFSLQCSSFSFTQNGKPVPLDMDAIEAYAALKFSNNGKALHKEPSAFLDSEYKKGIYRNDLGDYYSIQNEFPRVYGIGEGMLGKDATVKRRAQALQLQGFLLFFDQFLANYLAQLKNIRSLFSFSTHDATSHTYFTNGLTNIPQLQQLLRFRAAEGNDNIGGTQGGIIGYPTSRKNIEQLIQNNELKNTDLDRICKPNGKKDFPPYAFCFAAERDQALSQLQEDFLYASFTPVIVSNYNNCYFFYFFTSSPYIAIISQRYYKNETDAANAAASMKYAATLKKNFRSFGIACCEREDETYSFDIELNVDLYADYLQLIVENADLYTARRQQFLEHLMARFAENFSDFALLSSPFLPVKELQKKQVHAEELFLQHYDELSSNRGKGYDYLANKWGKYNISGFEKRFKALAGVEDWRRHFLCNFTVEPATKLYRLIIYLFDQSFTVENKIVPAEEALASLKDIYSRLMTPAIDYHKDSMTSAWKVFIADGKDNKYTCSKTFSNQTDAGAFKKQLNAVLKFKPLLPDDVHVSRHRFDIMLTDQQGKLLAIKKQPFYKEEEADQFIKDVSVTPASFITEMVAKDPLFENTRNSKLLLYAEGQSMLQFINEKAFNYKDTKEVQLKRNKKKFVLQDEEITFQFNSVPVYDDINQVKVAFTQLVTLLANESNYKVKKSGTAASYELFILDKDNVLAKYMEPFSTEKEGEDRAIEILEKVRLSTYKLYVEAPVEDEFEFSYSAENFSGDKINYQSNGHYKDKILAGAAATTFYNYIADVTNAVKDNRPLLMLDIDGTHIECVADVDTSIDQAAVSQQLLSFKQDLFNTISNPTESKLRQLLEDNNTNPGEDFIYKLVDKDGMPAYYTGFKKLTDTALAADTRKLLIDRASAGYNFADIIIGGDDIIHIRKEQSTGIKWYHYQLVCNTRKYKQGPSKDKNLVLFESVLGYQSQDAAMKAFLDNYLLILKYAANITAYGVGKNISLVEKIIHKTDCCSQRNSIVFVPKKTSDEYGGYEVTKELAPLAASYPVKYSKKHKYSFELGQVDDVAKTFTADWHSRNGYPSAIEAMHDFRFMLFLLKYAGNFYIEWDRKENCYQIFVREVLAESAHGYATVDDAWGKEGVEQFICVAQSEDGFHSYQNAQNCDYGFFVACGNTGLVHPCSYETKQRRDVALKSLYNAGSFNFLDLLSVDKNNGLVLQDNDEKHTRVAIIKSNTKINTATAFCQSLVSLAASADNDHNYTESKGSFQLNCRTVVNGKEVVDFIVRPMEANIKLNEWKIKLRRLAALVPVVAEEDACSNTGNKKYFVEIKFPGLNNIAEQPGIVVSNGNPCDDGCFSCCPVAWKSNCCFDDCCEAISFYISSLTQLHVIDNYRPVNDCDCGEYRVALHARFSIAEEKMWREQVYKLLEKYSWICNNNQQGMVVLGSIYNCENPVIAINPQPYTNGSMSCDAISKAKKLINSEGLHLAEHILLRPHCTDECSCKEQQHTADPTKILCHFPWEPGGEKDACELNKHVCFTPGCDPYSFIATVALPAWPERFRLVANRTIIEKMLQREAPAHIMLRILWLNPRDFCCFESHFVMWTELLARKINRKKYSPCNFPEFLFHKELLPLHECTDCKPCNCGDTQKQPCAEVDDAACNTPIADNINELFSWGKGYAAAFSQCEEGIAKPVSKRSLLRNNSTQRNLPVAVNVNMPVADAVAATTSTPIAENEVKKISKEEGNLINTRRNVYTENVKAIMKRKPESVLADKANRFLINPQPDAAQFKTLAEEIATDKINDTQENVLRKDESAVLINNIAWRYLDIACLTDKSLESIISLSDLFAFLRGHGFDMTGLFKGWDIAPIKKLNPTIKFKKIQGIVIGK